MKRYETDIYWLFVTVSGFIVLSGYEMTVRLHGTIAFIDVASALLINSLMAS